MLMEGENIPFNSAGLERNFKVFLPDNYDENQRYPLLVAYHGKNGETLPWQRLSVLTVIRNQ